ncbi:MAG: hypothetical protein ABIK22_06155 [candidate division WOR-3 bacterium]
MELQVADFMELVMTELCTSGQKPVKKALFAGSKIAKRAGQKFDKPPENSYHRKKCGYDTTSSKTRIETLVHSTNP